MARIQWARPAQLNWAFDNVGGAPLQEAVAGSWSNAMARVGEDGTVAIAAPNPGGGQVYYLRGVWRAETAFPWAGFWADPLSGDLTNYYQGGSFTNQGPATIVTLGTPLPPGTEVQLYYIYLTGEKSAKYEALNTYPCIRRAYRGPGDYTYDFPVDRLLDLMVVLHFAGQARGRDYGPMLKFLWEAFRPREESRTPPLVHDSFERSQWDRGPHLMYRGATAGNEVFEVFRCEPDTEAEGRVLHLKLALPGACDTAWFGYGLDWSLAESPFAEMDRVQFKLRGQAASRRVHNLTKVGSGSAAVMLLGDWTAQEKRFFVVEAEATGDVGQATVRWSQDGGATWQATGLTTGGRQHPLDLTGGLQICWEGGASPHLAAGDKWTFWAGDPAEHPRRLLVSLNDSQAQDSDPWGPAHTYVHALPDRFDTFTDFEVHFSQYWRTDNVIDDGDRVRAAWGAWVAAPSGDASQITVGDQEETLAFGGDTFYTQRRVTWNLTPYATAFGVWVGLDPGRCDSTGRSQVNFLFKPVLSLANTLTIRVKVKDARGSYFYRDVMVQVNAWQRVAVDLAEMLLESGSLPLTHPLQAVDLGLPGSPPLNGAFYVTDLKFDEHQTFSGAHRLRLLEFKVESQGLDEHEWWLDDLSLNLEAQDPYPFAPRLAISLTPYGQNPWRGPTPVHYAQPLAPWLAGALDLAQNYLNLHRDAQDEFQRRYGGLKGPIVPVHTRNDVENIALCGEENFSRFCWWPRYRDYGLLAGAWHFNGGLTDASGRGHDLSLSNPAYTEGICQPGHTALVFDGTAPASCPGAAFQLGAGNFTLEAVASFSQVLPDLAEVLLNLYAPGQHSWALHRQGTRLALTYSTDGASDCLLTSQDQAITAGGTFYHLVVTRSGGTLAFYVNGQPAGTADIGGAALFAGATDLRLGRTGGGGPAPLVGAVDYAAVHLRAVGAQEAADRWRIIQGQLNGSAYPEVGSSLGQFWAFQRLAQYYFFTNDPAAREILENWLTWIDAFAAADGPGWRLPQQFSQYGFTYGGYDPGAAAAAALGCLYIYFRGGHELADRWARRILDDLRENRLDPELGGYRSDYHYAWLNALVLQAFGLAVNGVRGQAYVFAATEADRDHFEAVTAWLFRRSGDSKPNLLNADLIPFSYHEAADVWDYTPHYLTLSQMGTLEGVVMMLAAALEYGQARGDWAWFERLLAFVLLDQLVVLGPSQIRSLTLAYDQAGVKNLVRVRYADYDQDPGKYIEVRDEAALAAGGEAAADLDCRYGAPVVVENPETARLLATRLLARLGAPYEIAEVETWLEGARLELGDTVALNSDFHGLAQAEFTLSGKEVDLGKPGVRLSLHRPLDLAWSWAVDAPGTAFDAYGIDQNSPCDPHWASRARAG